MRMFLVVIFYALIIGGYLAILVYYLSRIQMKGWLKQLDLHLGKKFINYINNKKEENGTEKEK